MKKGLGDARDAPSPRGGFGGVAHVRQAESELVDEFACVFSHVLHVEAEKQHAFAPSLRAAAEFRCLDLTRITLGGPEVEDDGAAGQFREVNAVVGCGGPSSAFKLVAWVRVGEDCQLEVGRGNGLRVGESVVDGRVRASARSPEASSAMKLTTRESPMARKTSRFGCVGVRGRRSSLAWGCSWGRWRRGSGGE
jgi:hypothetical protein